MEGILGEALYKGAVGLALGALIALIYLPVEWDRRRKKKKKEQLEMHGEPVPEDPIFDYKKWIVAILLAAPIVYWIYNNSLETNESRSNTKISSVQDLQPNQGQLHAILNQTVAQINSKAPMLIESGTRLDNAISHENTLRYNYTLVEYEMPRGENISLDQEKVRMLKNRVCTTMKTILGLGAELEYAYYDKKGSLIGVVNIRSTNCK